MSKILELAKKLKAMAERGEGAERENAEEKLKALMEKHGITEEDLNDDKIGYYVFDVKGENENLYLNLLRQLCGILHIKLYGDLSEKTRKTIRKTLSQNGTHFIETTKYKYIELESMFDFYKEKLSKEYGVFIYAFYLKNDLLAKAEDLDREPTLEELLRYRNAKKMSEGMSENSFKKQIENKTT
ncbi:MAG: hypothetical protein RLY43_914 [Bacteroidota bacterium]